MNLSGLSAFTEITLDTCVKKIPEYREDISFPTCYLLATICQMILITATLRSRGMRSGLLAWPFSASINLFAWFWTADTKLDLPMPWSRSWRRLKRRLMCQMLPLLPITPMDNMMGIFLYGIEASCHVAYLFIIKFSRLFFYNYFLTNGGWTIWSSTLACKPRTIIYFLHYIPTIHNTHTHTIHQSSHPSFTQSIHSSILKFIYSPNLSIPQPTHSDYIEILTKGNRFQKFEQFPCRAVEKGTTTEGFFAELVTVQEDVHLGAHAPSTRSSQVIIIACVPGLCFNIRVCVCFFASIYLYLCLYPISVSICTFMSLSLPISLAILTSLPIYMCIEYLSVCISTYITKYT